MGPYCTRFQKCDDGIKKEVSFLYDTVNVGNLPRTVLVETKSGRYGFPDVFKVLG